MKTAKLMEDGVLQLPPEITGRINVKPGDILSAEVDKNGVIHLYPKTTHIEDVCGMLVPRNTAHVSVEQKDVAVVEENGLVTLYERWQSFIGIAEGLPEDFAENHDHYAHGRPKQ